MVEVVGILVWKQQKLVCVEDLNVVLVDSLCYIYTW